MGHQGWPIARRISEERCRLGRFSDMPGAVIARPFGGPSVNVPGIPMKVLVALLILIGASLSSESATAGKSPISRADQIQISYVPPKNSAHEAIFQLLKERRTLEKVKGLLSALRLPRTLLLKVEGCDGESNAT